MRDSYRAGRRGTSTSSFGVSRRESHDASGFYERFVPPDLTTDTKISPRKDVDEIFLGDARHMEALDDSSVALVVTSPPYFAGKEYETALGEGHVPATYAAYLAMLEEVLAECVRKLEPGGRIAVNVANLGRKPYRSLSGDVASILQDRLRLLLRGEVIWIKARGATGSCAWGSFQRPANPVLRDLSERIVIAGKGRFDRAVSPRERFERRLPSEASISRDEFMEATTDLWEIAPESASRVGHPAPFPIELPERLIHLYTYRGDLVLDPFMGSGTTAVAALRTERHFAGYDTDPQYVASARARIESERSRLDAGSATEARRVVLSGGPAPPSDDEDFPGSCGAGGAGSSRSRSRGAGAVFVRRHRDQREAPGGDRGQRHCPGRKRRAVVLRRRLEGSPRAGQGCVEPTRCGRPWARRPCSSTAYPASRLVLLTTDLPTRSSAGDATLAVVRGPDRPIRDVILLSSAEDLHRLRGYAEGH